ncbi:MAG TPA: SAM-dependent methyltransferase [Candidatus Sulfotelmatobacter sp.]|nr:SAM-dependent methyltransferase [Candidatus Sulfotelmatobacter sp.]
MTTTRPIENVSDTALWVALYRAMESERPDAHFRDPYARRLAGERGEEILRGIPGGKSLSWPMVVRTCLFDEILARLLGDPGLDAVLNLAAGLDARPWRMPLPPELRWADLDLPAMLEHKRQVMGHERPRCRYESVAVDLREPGPRREALARLTSGAGRVLAMCEGLLVYLDREEVAALAADLHAAGIRWWLIDLASPMALQFMQKRWAKSVHEGGAQFKFGPPEGTRFFEASGWREVEFRSTWDESARLKRQMAFAWAWRFLGRFSPPERREMWRRFSGTVLLERT